MLKNLISLHLSISLKRENEKQKVKLTFSRLEDQKNHIYQPEKQCILFMF